MTRLVLAISFAFAVLAHADDADKVSVELTGRLTRGCRWQSATRYYGIVGRRWTRGVAAH